MFSERVAAISSSVRTSAQEKWLCGINEQSLKAFGGGTLLELQLVAALVGRVD